MDNPLDHLTEIWVSSGRWPWGGSGTYQEIPKHRLPTLPELSRHLLWLENIPECGSSTLDCEDNQIAGISHLVGEAAALGLELPQDLLLLLSSAQRQRRIPTCTGCSLQLSDSLIPVTGMPGVHVLRFLNDSQFCYMWYLVLQKGKEAAVIASKDFFEPDIFEMLTDPEDGPAYEEIWASSMLCSLSFTEFLFRFTIENSIWFARNQHRPLCALEQDYQNQILPHG